MITKVQFVEIVTLLETAKNKDARLGEALQDYTGDKEFTGFFKPYEHLEKWLAKVMNDEDGLIEWYLYDKPTSGGFVATGRKGTPDYREWNIMTYGDLYDLLVYQRDREIKKELEEVTKDHTQTTLDLALKAQTNGVSFALTVLEEFLENYVAEHEDYLLVCDAIRFVKDSYADQTNVVVKAGKTILVRKDK